jgi:signal peptidase II
MYFIFAVLIIILDQVTKQIALSGLVLNHSSPIVQGFLNLSLTYNYGAAFSILQNRQAILIPITLIVSGIILYFMIKTKKTGHWTLMLSFALILGGGIGTLIDRIRLGYVIDYLEFKFIQFPVFNVADMSVVCGSALLVIYVLFIETKVQKAMAESDDK